MEREVEDLLAELVQIESHQSVDRAREFLVDTIEGASIHPESGCVVATKGSPDDDGPNVFLNSHVDVVPPHLPFERDGDVIHGRGACDAKGSLVPLIAGFSRVEPTTGSVTLVVSPDEETYSEGLYDYLSLEGDRGDMAVVGEPTGLDVCNAARGSLKYIIELDGAAAHSGTPGSGLNAVSAAAKAIQRVENMDQRTHEYLGETSQTISWIEGGPVGELTSQVPRRVRLFLNRWSVPPETPQQYREAVEEELAELDCEVTVRYPYMPNRFLEAHEVDADEPVIQSLADSAADVTGDDVDIRPFAVAAESSFFQRYMPVAIFGPGLTSDEDGPIAHSDREHIHVPEVETAADVVTQFLERTI